MTTKTYRVTFEDRDYRTNDQRQVDAKSAMSAVWNAGRCTTVPAPVRDLVDIEVWEDDRWVNARFQLRVEQQELNARATEGMPC